ncbi:sigma-54 interaction domain-containing protein [Wukongibacter sp. M2B1]|uniref:sigma-54 interaction domain-containing protein n=1 Tax=Wukongibacter sp. M2B1 TaxID=3088895 RepID=UPI003D7A71B7
MLSLFKEVLNNVLEGIIILNANHKIVYMNKPAKALFSQSLNSFEDLASCFSINDNIENLGQEKKIEYLGRFLKISMKFSTIDSENYFIIYIEDCTNLYHELRNNTKLTLNDIVGSSAEIRRVLKKAKMASKISSPILIYGEAGTGKDLFVQAIHNENPITKHHSLISINCRTIPESLLEGLIFGVVKGSFSDSTNSVGLLEQAGQGTLFLDEINKMSLNLQEKLLNVLTEKKYRKFGGKEVLPVKCRIISSTNVDPLECINASTLRKDLYFKLAVVSLEIPPLRKRLEDIPALIEYFIKDFSMKHGKPTVSISNNLKTMLSSYSWPENVKELKHVMEAAMTMIDCEDTLMPRHLPEKLISIFEAQNILYPKPSIKNLSEVLLNAERETILHALDTFDWNVSRTSRELGIARQNLQYRIRKLKLSRPAKNV